MTRHASHEARTAPSTWANRYVALATALLVVAVGSIWYVSSYMQLAPSEILSFPLSDNWCIPSQEGIGVHCFGDYAIARSYFAGDFDPWNGAASLPPSNYSAIGWLPALAASWLGSLLGGGRASLVIYLAAELTCLLTPAFWVGWRAKTAELPTSTLLLGVASAPVLIAIDRGNSVAFAVPFMLVAGIALVRRRWTWVVVGIVGAAILKPQLALLAVLLLVNRRYRDLAVTAVATAGLTVAGFAAFPHFPTNLLNWVKAVTAYSAVQSAESTYPVNLGVGRSVVTLLDFLGAGQLMGAGSRTALAQWLDANGTTINLCLLATIAIVLWLSAKHIPAPWSLTLAVFAVLYSSSTVYTYYLTLFLVVVAVIVRDPDLARPVSLQRSGALDIGDAQPRSIRAVNGALITVLALVMAPVIVPTQLLGDGIVRFWNLDGARTVYQTALGPALLVLFCFLVLGSLWQVRRRHRAAS